MEKDDKRWMKPKEVADYFSVHVQPTLNFERSSSILCG